MKRRLLWSVLAVLLLAVAVLAWLLGTGGGLRFVLGQLLPPDITVEQAEGSLSRGLELGGLRIRQEGLQIEIAETRAQIDVWRLPRGELAIDQLLLRDVTVTINEKPGPGGDSAAATSWSWPEPRLPIALAVSGPRIEGLVVLRGPETLLVADRVQAEQLAYRAEEWALGELQVHGERVNAKAGFRYRAGGDHNIRTNITLSTYLNDNPIETNVKVVGNDQKLALSGQVEGAVEGELEGALETSPRGPAWQLLMDLAITHPARLNPAWPDQPISLRGRFEGDGSALRGEGRLQRAAWPELDFVVEADGLPGNVVVRNLRISEPDGGAYAVFTGALTPGPGFPDIDGRVSWPVLEWPPGSDPSAADTRVPAGSLTVTGEGGLYRVSGATDASAAPGTGSFEINGQLDLRGVPVTLDLEGRWRELALRVAGDDWKSRDGRILFVGHPDEYRFETRFTAVRNQRNAFEFHLEGDGSLERLQIEKGSATAGDGELTFEGQMQLVGARAFGFALKGRNLDPAIFDPAWPGRLSIDARLDGAWGVDGITARLEEIRVDGRLRGQALSARVRARVAEGQLRSGEIDARWGAANLVASASDEAQNLLEWSVSVPDLAALTPRGAGSVNSEGELRGTLESPHLTLRLQGTGLRYRDLEAQSLSADLDAAATGTQLNIEAGALRVNDTELGTLSLQGSGDLEKHTGTMRLSGAQPAFEIGFRGGWASGRWTGELNEGQVSLDGEPWVQKEVAQLLLGAGQSRLSGLCLVKNSGEVCVQGTWPSAEEPLARLEIRSLLLNELEALLPEGLSYTGSLSGSVLLRSPGPVVRAEARFTANNLKVLRGEDEASIPLLELADARGQVDLGNGRLSLDMEGVTSASLPFLLEFSALLDGWSLAEGPINGRVRGGFTNLGLLALLVPDIAGVRGQVRTDLQLGGSLARPELRGLVEVSEGSADIPALGITVTGINGRATGQDGTFDLDISGTSGGGELSLSGRALRAAGQWQGGLQLSGTGFLASDLPEARVVITPQLSLQFSGRELNLTGEVQVAEARITPRDLRTAVQASPDEVVVSADTEERLDDRWRWRSEVGINLSEAVYFSGFGLDARVSGGLRVTDASGAVTTAVGELEIVDGTYQIYGRELEVRRGRLLFSGGPLANPGLDVMATRTVQEDIVAGVLVRASLREPRVSLYSEPSMPPSQALSYLLVGQPLADIGDSDRQLVNDAAGRLASAGGGLLAQQLGRRLGLDDVNIASSGSGDQASLVIGTYLSPKLYASYGVGLFEDVNTLRLRYLLSSRWTLRAESGLNQSVDLEYSLTR